jgi:CelD/BcsL family acetyltransferase involved in cellulose biosynthesis
MSSTTLFRTEAETAKRQIERTGPILVDTSLGSIRLVVTDDLPGLEALWEELRQTAPCTSAQTYNWARAWARHVLGSDGGEPVIAVGYGADGRPLFLWPFEVSRKFGMKVLNWLGQAQANF